MENSKIQEIHSHPGLIKAEAESQSGPRTMKRSKQQQ